MERPEIDIAEAEQRISAGVPLIDVRQPEEFEQVRVPGAVLCPLDQLEDRLSELPTTGEVLMICKTGGRSAAATDFLRSVGIDAINVAGGTLGWAESGRPTSSGEGHR